MAITPANKAQKKLRVALYGDSGNGKSHSAIMMARATGGHVLVIDSEDGASHSFSDLAEFDVLKLDDVTLPGYIKAIDEAIKNGSKYNAVVIDSLSHAWQSALNQVSTYSNTTLGWGKVTPQWDALIHRIKRLDAHVFVTMRAKKRQENNNQWHVTWDARENSDYDFDLMLQMTGLKNVEGKTVARGIITKNRFNTPDARLAVGSEINAAPALIRYILEWQKPAPPPPDEPKQATAPPPVQAKTTA